MLNRRLITRLAIAAAVCAPIAIVAEMLGRRYPSLMPAQWQVEQFSIRYPFAPVPDPDIGFSMPASERRVIETRDYTFLSETDRHGYPNREPWSENPTLVLLGDSLVIGAGVGIDDSFAGLLQRLEPPQRVINLGLAGAGPARQLRIFRRFASSWTPDVVLACVFLASDFENDFHFLRWLADGQGADYNAFRLNLARNARYRGILQRLSDKSWLLDRSLRATRRWIVGGHQIADRHRFADGTEVLFERHALEFAHTPAVADDPRLDAFAAALRELRAAIEGTGARMLLVLIPSKEELFSAPPSVAAANLGALAKERLAAMALPVLDLYEPLKQRGADAAPYYSQDIHLNAVGNRVVAQEIAAWLDRNGYGERNRIQ